MEPQDIINAITDQRNQALNAVAICQAEIVALRKKVTELEEKKIHKSSNKKSND